MADDPIEPAQQQPEENPDALDPTLAIPHGREVIAVVEALLFSATQPMALKRLSVLTNGVPEEEISQAIQQLRQRYEDPGSGLTIMEIAGGFQIATKAEFSDWVFRLHRHRKKNPLTPALLETLAIVAYKQPITRAEVEAIRGVDCGTSLRSLQDAEMVDVVGRKDVLGRPPLYGTTEMFLKVFGLRTIEDLPSVGELKGLFSPRPADGQTKGASGGSAPTPESAPLAPPPAE